MPKSNDHPSVTKRLLEIMTITIASDLEPEIKNQADFAEAIGVHPATISQWISGAKQVTIEQLISLCSRFKVSGNYLLNGTGDTFLPGHKLQNMNARIENKLDLMYEDLELLKTAITNLKPVTETRNKRHKMYLKRAK